MIGGVLENKQQGRVGEVKTIKHFMALERYLVSPDEDGNTDERLLRLRNTYSLNSHVDPNDKQSINDYVISVKDGYNQFMEEIGRSKKPPKTRAKHSVVSFRPDEITKLEAKIKKKYPDISKENLQNKVLDFVEQMAMQYMDNHMTNKKKNIKGLNRQYTIAIHGEKDHLHAHIVCNTVCYDNKVYSKTREDLHNQEWCARMAEKYDFLAQGLDFKKVNDYVLDETQKKTLENNVKNERSGKRKEFVNACEEASINHKAVLGELKAAISSFKDNDLIKPDNVIKAFESINKRNLFKIQPVFHIKASKVSGMSFKVHSKGKTVTIKSSLLPAEYQFKAFKKNVQEYDIDRKAYDKLNSWFDFVAGHTYEGRATIRATSKPTRTFDEFKSRYKSRYFEFNKDGTGLKFKNAWSDNLKNKTVLSFKENKSIDIHVLNPAVVKEAIRVAKDMGWKEAVITTRNEETAKLYIKEAEEQGLRIRFDNPEIQKAMESKSSCVIMAQKEKEHKPEQKPENAPERRYKNVSRYAPKLKPTFNTPKIKKKDEDDKN